MTITSPPDSSNTVFCVLVEYDNDRSRRRIYLSLSGAENAVERAQKAGRDVSVQLAELKPLAAGERR